MGNSSISSIQTGTDAQKPLLGTANTDWNDEIYNVAFGTDNNLSFSGKLKNIPYRVSLGYYNQDGILRTDNAERITGNISVSPGFFNNYLKFNVNIKGSLNKNRFANDGAIWAASTYNPTLPYIPVTMLSADIPKRSTTPEPR